MALHRILLTLTLVAVCIGLSLGRPPRGPRHGADDDGQRHKQQDLKKFTCKLENSTDIFINKTCGCGDEADIGVTCTLGPLSVTKNEETYQATFCDISPDWTKPEPWRGVLGAACKISTDEEMLKEESCGSLNGTDIECSEGPLSVTFNETISAQVFFCQKPERDSEDGDKDEDDRPNRRHNSRPHSSSVDDAEDEDDEVDETEGDSDETLEEQNEDEKRICVPLTPRHHHKRGHKGGDRDETSNPDDRTQHNQRSGRPSDRSMPNERPEGGDDNGDDENSGDSQPIRDGRVSNIEGQTQVGDRPFRNRQPGNQERQGSGPRREDQGRGNREHHQRRR